MNNQSVGYKTKRFELRNLLLFFLIAFGWTWLWWFLVINGSIKMPPGIGTPNVDLGTAGPVILILLLSPFGPTIAAFVVTGISEGKSGLKTLLQRFWNREINLKWLLYNRSKQESFF